MKQDFLKSHSYFCINKLNNYRCRFSGSSYDKSKWDKDLTVRTVGFPFPNERTFNIARANRTTSSFEQFNGQTSTGRHGART
jgi:hypothetical protein